MSDAYTDNTMALYNALERIDELEAENEALRGRVAELEIGLMKFCGQCEFKESVSGTMGHLQDAYDYAQRIRAEADQMEGGE